MESRSDVMSPLSAPYKLSHYLESASGGTRCGCIIQDASLAIAQELPASLPDYELLVTGGTDGEIMIWKLLSGNTVDLLNAFVGHEGTVMDVISCKMVDFDTAPEALPSIGAKCTALDASITFYTCGRDRLIHRFNVAGRKTLTLVGHEDVVCSLYELPSGNHIVSGSWDGTAIIWNPFTGAMEHRLGGSPYKYSVYCNAVDEDTLVTGMTNGDVCFWKGAHLERAIQAHDGVIRAISIHNNTVLTCSNDCSVRKYSEQMELIFAIPFAHENFVYDVRHSKYFPAFFTSSEDKTVGVWDIATGNRVQSLTMESSIWKVVETRSHGIVVIPLNGNVSIWKLTPGVIPHIFSTPAVPPSRSYAKKPETTEGSFEMTTFRKANGTKALEHLRDFNQTKPPDLALSEKDLKVIDGVFSGNLLPNSELAFVFKLIRWPIESRVPVFDFMKLLLLNPFCTSLFKGRHSGFQIYNCVCTSIETCKQNVPLTTVALQLLANMLVLTLPRTIVLSHVDTTVEAVKRSGEICTKMVQQAHSACLGNLIIALGDRLHERSGLIVDCLQSVFSSLRRARPSEPWINSVILRHCRSIDTMLFLHNETASLIRNTGLISTIHDVAQAITVDEQHIIKETVQRLMRQIG